LIFIFFCDINNDELKITLRHRKSMGGASHGSILWKRSFR